MNNTHVIFYSGDLTLAWGRVSPANAVRYKGNKDTRKEGTLFSESTDITALAARSDPIAAFTYDHLSIEWLVWQNKTGTDSARPIVSMKIPPVVLRRKTEWARVSRTKLALIYVVIRRRVARPNTDTDSTVTLKCPGLRSRKCHVTIPSQIHNRLTLIELNLEMSPYSIGLSAMRRAALLTPSNISLGFSRRNASSVCLAVSFTPASSRH